MSCRPMRGHLFATAATASSKSNSTAAVIVPPLATGHRSFGGGGLRAAVGVDAEAAKLGEGVLQGALADGGGAVQHHGSLGGDDDDAVLLLPQVGARCRRGVQQRLVVLWQAAAQ